MSTKLPILSLSHQAYADAIVQRLGRGRQHAIHLYEEFFRNGTCQGRHPAFLNAQLLLQEIVEATDWQLAEVSNKKEEGETQKFLMQTADRLDVESVIIPMQAGGTLCISSQVGCKMGCAFCETGKMGLLRHLTPTEIVSQVYLARHQLGAAIRNIVFMGMGEPFDNFDAVMQAVEVLTDPHGFGFGRRHLTISTSGVVEGIERMAAMRGSAPNLAVSLNAPNDLLRNQLMPVNRHAPLSRLRQAMENYCQQTGRQILVAYVLMAGINDKISDADELAQFLRGLDIKINLIPYNAQSRDRFAASTLETQQAFWKRLREHGYCTLLRTTKGSSIMAACGQLGNLKLRQERSRILQANQTLFEPLK